MKIITKRQIRAFGFQDDIKEEGKRREFGHWGVSAPPHKGALSTDPSVGNPSARGLCSVLPPRRQQELKKGTS